MIKPSAKKRKATHTQARPFQKKRRRALGLLVVVGAASAVGVSQATTAPPIHFDIQPGETPGTLEKYQDQAKIKISYDPNIHVKTRHVGGEYSAQVALAKLLKGTELKGTFLPTGEVAIERKQTLTRSDPQGVWPSAPSRVSSQSDSETMPQVIINTGTLRKEGEPIGSDLIRRTAADIEYSNAVTIPEFLQTQTQNFGAGPSQDTQHDGAGSASNSGLGSATNLRGLGARATLVLINGRRPAPSGDNASFFDTENIPAGAVDHIDILPGGGSAFYGTDAVAGAVNIVLRDRFSGVELRAEGGGETEGGRNYFRFSPQAGINWDTGRIYMEGEWYRRGALQADRRSFMNPDLRDQAGVNLGTPYSLLPTLTFLKNTYAVPPGVTGILDLSTLQPGTQNLSNPHVGADVVPYQQLLSTDIAFRQELGEYVTMFIDFLHTDRDAYQWQGGDRASFQIPGDSPLVVNRPINSNPITVLYDFGNLLGDVLNTANVRTFNIAAGVDATLWERWDLLGSVADVWETEHQYTLGIPNTGEAQTALGLGTFNPFVLGGIADSNALTLMRTTPSFDSRSEIHTVTAVMRGSFGSVDGVAFECGFGIELRDQLFYTLASPPETYMSLRRRVGAVFGEAVIPVLGRRDTDYGFKNVAVSLAGRVEYYSIFGRVATPRIGINWAPFEGFELKASWGREIRAPNLGDLHESSNGSAIISLPDPYSISGTSNNLIVSGQYAGLQPERATTRTAGFHWTHSESPRIFVQGDYYSISFGQVIQNTPFSQSLLSDRNFSGIVTRNPSVALRASICDNPNNHYAGVLDCLTEPIAALIDLRFRNLGTVRTDGVDLNASASLDLGDGGSVTGELGGTYILSYTTTAMPLAPRENLLNTIGEPVARRLAGSLRWERGAIGLAVNVANTGSYRDFDSIPARGVSSLTTIDVQASVSFGEGFGPILQNSRLIFCAKNLIDRAPPFVINRATATGYDAASADPYGRVVSVGISKRLN